MRCLETRLFVKATCEVTIKLKLSLTAFLMAAMEVLMFNGAIFTTNVVLMSVFVGAVLLRSWLGLQLERYDFTLLIAQR